MVTSNVFQGFSLRNADPFLLCDTGLRSGASRPRSARVPNGTLARSPNGSLDRSGR